MEFVVIKPYIIYKAIYNNTFLNKEFLHSWHIYTNNKGAIYSTSVFVTDLISRIVQVLRGDLYWVKISTQEAGLMELVEPWDEG